VRPVDTARPCLAGTTCSIAPMASAQVRAGGGQAVPSCMLESSPYSEYHEASPMVSAQVRLVAGASGFTPAQVSAMGSFGRTAPQAG
jgi:hypothetical protein